MREFIQTEEFKDEFRHAAQRYLRAVEQARERQHQTKGTKKNHKRDSWQVDLAAALERRAWDRVSRAEGKIIRLIQALAGEVPIPAAEVFNDSSTPIASFPSVECMGMIFALIGEETNFVVRPSWLSVRVGEPTRVQCAT